MNVSVQYATHGFVSPFLSMKSQLLATLVHDRAQQLDGLLNGRQNVDEVSTDKTSRGDDINTLVIGDPLRWNSRPQEPRQKVQNHGFLDETDGHVDTYADVFGIPA